MKVCPGSGGGGEDWWPPWAGGAAATWLPGAWWRVGQGSRLLGSHGWWASGPEVIGAGGSASGTLLLASSSLGLTGTYSAEPAEHVARIGGGGIGEADGRA
ncbi:hypothetical protein NDU88_000769 [Pleurodeles waltl]|uniref:Uncharacterized protein n=1 Tax=Pleurodeles waltl TaxID=8319 RepID=A0AAV7LB32_PLEWA|nr:hypothetical protein NDU88_000769 [Pleurodeles waltl]